MAAIIALANGSAVRKEVLVFEDTFSPTFSLTSSVQPRMHLAVMSVSRKFEVYKKSPSVHGGQRRSQYQ